VTAYPIPVALIGRLAVHTTVRGTGFGSILVADACSKVAQASAVLAVAGIVVDANDETAASFCTHFGFVALPGQRTRLLLPAKLLPAPT
jgi:predicted GNAT family N-acyltransferase